MAGKKRGKNPSAATQRELWAKSAGVCQYPGCGIVLYQDETVFWEPINLGEIAHNVGSSVDGPRGSQDRSHNLSDDPENILMLCRHHHGIVDSLVQQFREETLTLWKNRHESQVLAAAQLTKGHVALPVICSSTQIGGHPVHIDQHSVVQALIEHGLAPIAKPQQILIDTSGQPDNSSAYWTTQANTIRDKVKFIRSQVNSDHNGSPLAIFPLAEMPTLIMLGHAIGDKAALRIFQYSRHNNSWAFSSIDGEAAKFNYEIPQKLTDDIVLVISLSATIDDTRIEKALGRNDLPIIHFTTKHPSTELVNSPKTIEAFRTQIRQCLTDIESRSNRDAVIHVFPCMPASLATAFGCCIMPKVSNPIVIYDAKGFGGIFSKCIELPFKLDNKNIITTQEEK